MSRTFPSFAEADAYRNTLETTGQRVVVLGTDDGTWIVSVAPKRQSAASVAAEALAFLTIPPAAVVGFIAAWVALPTGWIFA